MKIHIVSGFGGLRGSFSNVTDKEAYQAAIERIKAFEGGGMVMYEPEPRISENDRIDCLEAQSLRDAGWPEEVVQNFERYKRKFSAPG